MENKQTNNRFIEMARAYDTMAPFCVPFYDVMQDELLKLIPFEEDQTFTLVDLGAGSGRFLEKVCNKYKNVHCWHIDSSDTFQELAKERLISYKNRVQYINNTIESSWENIIPDKVDCIVSMNTIHHLTSEEKRNLYHKSVLKLNNGGVFFNCDEVRSEDKNVYLNNMLFWSYYVDKAGLSFVEYNQEQYKKWCFHFDKWKERNIAGIDNPKIKGDDMHHHIAEQVKWLKETDLTLVDIYFQMRLWAIFGGYKN